MNRQEIIAQIKKKQSFLCVGLDPDLTKLPKSLLSEKEPIFTFNKAIIDTTKEFAVAYKPNTAFYEALGAKGWKILEKTIEYIPKDIFIIADAKRGDIGNTSGLYAKAFFEKMNVDAVTVAPYMGSDSVMPFLNYKGKWVILLALTSNKGAEDFQLIKNETLKLPLYNDVLKKAAEWGNEENMMFVVGATRPKMLQEIRKIVPNHFLLVPGVGAQGGTIEDVCKYGLNKDVGLLINSSRSILYASSEADFARKAGEKAKAMQEKMRDILVEKEFVI